MKDYLLHKIILKVTAFLFTVLATLPFNAEANSWKWIAYGDTRTNDKRHREVLQSIMNNTPDYEFIINVGDVVEDGAETSQWNKWQAACNDILGGTGQDLIPPEYMSAPGNHDNTETTAGLANWNIYLSGQVEQFGNDGKFFVFDYENARFVIMDSDKSEEEGAQLTMLLDAIENNPKTWLFAIWHHPIFDFGEKKYEDKFHDLWGVPLYQAGCDIIFAGHAHYYVRTKKLGLDGELHPPLDPENGTVQVVTGNSGASMDVPVPNHDNNSYMVASYSTHDRQYGYTELSVNDTILHLRHILRDGTIFDEEYLTPNLKTGELFTDEGSNENTIPTSYHMTQNYPNPFNPKTSICYSLPQSNYVRLVVYDIMGHTVSTLVDEIQGTGTYMIDWEAVDSYGRILPSGIYFYRIQAGAFTKTLKMIILY